MASRSAASLSPRAASGLAASLADWLTDWGAFVIEMFVAVGSFAQFVARTFAWMFTRLPRRETLLPNFFEVGVLSLPVVAMTGTFIGMVLAVQSYFQFRQLGLGDATGGCDQHVAGA